MDAAFLVPPILARPGEIAINPWSYQSLGIPLYGIANTPASANYVTVNLALFVPFWVPETVTITKLGWMNGSAVAGNIDVGIYSEAAARLVSTGSTAQSGTSRLQVVDTGDITLARGRYYMAMATDTSGATQKVFAATPAAGICQAFGILQMATAFPLPDPATFAKCVSAFVPHIFAQGYRTFGP
jgi:hypothetical protein